MSVKRAPLALALVLAVLFCTGPFAWQIVTSMRPEGEIGELSLPSSITFESYRSVFTEQPFLRVLFNSFAVASMTTVLCLSLGAAAAFALAKLELRGRRVILAASLLASMFPQVATVSPIYLIIRALGLRDRLFGLLIPYTTFALPTTLWILSGFFRDIPDEIYKAAILDGCSPLQAFRKVMLPLAAPGIGTTAILVFISAWNEFLYALTLTTSPTARTVPVAISLFSGEHKEPWGQIAAASVIATLPVVLVALSAQRLLVSGLTAGAVKR
jgi:multiple sugar transport system permease protein